MVNNNQSLPDIYLPTGYVTFEQMNAILDFRRLWAQMAAWTRSFIYSIINNNPNITAVTKRLYEGVPLDFYNTLRVFYGPEIAEQFLQIISAQILIFWRLINSIIQNNAAAVNSATVELYQNAEQISTFLSQININWDKQKWNNLLTQYISMMIEHILSIVRGNFDREIAIFDRLEKHALLMGSYMAKGVILRGSDNQSAQ